MLPLPPKVRVGFRTYDIVPLEEGATSKNGEDVTLLGRHAWQGTIEISPHYNPEEVVNSMFHETLHAIIDVYNLDMADDTTEERLVRTLAAPLTAFVRDNPDVIEWMLELCKMRDIEGKTSSHP